MKIVFLSVWSAAIDALTAFIKCFLSPKAVNYGILLQPVLVYLSRYLVFQLKFCSTCPNYFWVIVQRTDYFFGILNSALSHVSLLASKDFPGTKAAVDVLIIRTLIAYQSLSDPIAYRNDHPKLLHLCSGPFRYCHAKIFILFEMLICLFDFVLCFSFAFMVLYIHCCHC